MPLPALGKVLKAILLAVALFAWAPSAPAEVPYDKGFEAYQSGDYIRAFRIWLRLARSGHAQAQNSLAFLFKHGRGTPQDYQKAVFWYRQAAEQGRTEAIYDLGIMFDEGLGVAQNAARAQDYYEQAARDGFAPAHNNLGILLESAQGIPNDRRAAYFHYAVAERIGGTQHAAGNRAKLAEQFPQDVLATLNRMVQDSANTDLYPGWAEYIASAGPPEVTDDGDYPGRQNLKSPLSTREVAELQAGLIRLGYNPGPADGIIGRATMRAIRAYQRDQNLTVNGRASRLLLDRVRQRVAALDPPPSPPVSPPPPPLEPPQPPPPPPRTALALDLPDSVAGSDATLTLEGRVTGESPVITIEGEEVSVDADGRFTHGIYVVDGEKTVTVVARDDQGGVVTHVVTLTREREEPEQFADLDVELTPLNPARISVRENPNAVAVVIGMESYRSLPNAVFADRDAKAFADYARYALGVSPSRIKMLIGEDASYAEIRKALSRWLPTVVEEGETDIYIFFAGHGLSEPEGSEAYLLPYDGDAELLEFLALNRSEILEDLAALGGRSTVVMLDTCFSGPGRAGDLLIAARPVFSVPAETVPSGVTVLSAATGSQTAGSLPERGHGLFSYFLMRGLEGEANTDGDDILTAGELSDWVSETVTKATGMLGRALQTPGLEGDRSTVLVRYGS